MNKPLTKKEKYELRRQKKEIEQAKKKRKKTLNRFLFWGVVIFILSASAYTVASITGGSERYRVGSIDEVTSEDQAKGNRDADVVLIEYSDFECPACRNYFPITKEILEEFGEEVLFVYRHFPISSIHANAETAARVAEAAGRQGYFWEMHDMIFDQQPEWRGEHDAKDRFFDFAEELGMDMIQFEEDYNSPEVRQKVSADYSSGLRAGVRGTPTFFLNGDYFPNPQNYQEFRAIISDEVERQREPENEQEN